MQKILLASLVSAAFAMPAVAAEQADVVIIGSGGAGLSAAVTAHDLGKKVIVLLLSLLSRPVPKLSFLKKWLWSAATQTVQPAV